MEFVHVLSVSTTVVLASVSPAAKHSTVLNVLTISVLIAEIDILRVSVAIQLSAAVLQVLTEITRILLSALTAPSQTVAFATPLLVPHASLVFPR